MMQNQANIFTLYINNQLQLSLTAFLNIMKRCLSTARVSRRGCLTNTQLKTGAFTLLRCLQHIQHMQISPLLHRPPFLLRLLLLLPHPHTGSFQFFRSARSSSWHLISSRFNTLHEPFVAGQTAFKWMFTFTLRLHNHREDAIDSIAATPLQSLMHRSSNRVH